MLTQGFWLCGGSTGNTSWAQQFVETSGCGSRIGELQDVMRVSLEKFVLTLIGCHNCAHMFLYVLDWYSVRMSFWLHFVDCIVISCLLIPSQQGHPLRRLTEHPFTFFHNPVRVLTLRLAQCKLLCYINIGERKHRHTTSTPQKCKTYFTNYIALKRIPAKWTLSIHSDSTSVINCQGIWMTPYLIATNKNLNKLPLMALKSSSQRF